MTDDSVSPRPSGSIRSDGSGGFGATPPGVTVVQRVADVAGESPIDLPTLNETIDVDALDALLSGGDEWPTVSFRYADRAVRVDASGAVAVSGGAVTEPADEWTHVSPVDGVDGRGFVVAVTTAIADRSDRDPARVRRELDAVVDLEAVDRLNRPRANGVPRTGATVRFSSSGYDVVVSPGGSIAVGSALTRLERAGGNVLLTGAVPDAIVDLASETLLGEGDRRRVFALLDRDVDAVADRLPAAGATAPTHVIDRASTSRSAADRPTARKASTTVETASLADVPGAIERTLSTLRTDGPRLDPAPVRLCVDSLRPVLEERSVDEATAFLEPICRAVAETGTLAHYVLPVERSSPAVAAIEGLFDATVELRAGENRPEQRWHLHGGDVATEWVPLDDPS